MKQSPSPLILLLLLLLPDSSLISTAVGTEYGPAPADEDQLNMRYYARSCPNFEAIVGGRIAHWLSVDHTLGPSLIKLLYHDCAVRGCDASVLLNNPGGERHSPTSKTLRGFHVIDDIKAELERRCPKTVSCADILVAAARDATHVIGGPFWENVYGRKDGRTSVGKDTEAIPKGGESITYLIEFFESLGLDKLDLVILSGAHTVGRAMCGSVQPRLFNYTGIRGRCDPSINPKYANYLKRKCRWASTYVDLDPTTPAKFDNAYYRNLNARMGLFATDQPLLSNSRTGPLVHGLTCPTSDVFVHQFARSMKNLADTLVLEHIGCVFAEGCPSANFAEEWDEIRSTNLEAASHKT